VGRFIHREDDDEYLDLSREARPFTRIVVFVVLVVALIGGGLFFSREWYERQVDPPGGQGDDVAIEIEKGTSVAGITNQLAEEKVVKNANVFRFWLRDKDLQVQAGQYEFRKNSSFEQALTTLEAGPKPPDTIDVTVPEGLTLPQISAAMVKAQPKFTFEQVVAALADPTIRSKYQPADQASLEGLIYPSTYELGKDEDAASAVRRMVAQTDTVADELDILGGSQRLGLSPYQLIVAASLIQEEAGSVEEMPKIARVIYNRLSDGTPLGIDATSRYLAEQSGSPVDFTSTSPFNTRRVPGLPPTPIAAPGRDALQAALAPADGPWTYYVLEDPGVHFFTDSNAEFLQKKQECEAEGLGCG
jgi:UPF0755 protein